MPDIYDTIHGLLQQGEDVVFARVISDQGSAPRGTGASMLIRRNGEIHGTVGGGLVEASAMSQARELFKSKRSATFAFDMTGDLLEGKMVCGGKVELLLEFIPADTETADIFAAIAENRRDNRKSFLVVPVPDQGNVVAPGQRWLLCGNDSPAGNEGEDTEALASLKDNVRALAASSLVECEGKRYWADVIVNGGTVYIFGAGHISREVAGLALRVGFNVVVLDDRDEYANKQRFASPIEVVVLKSFDTCFDGLPVDTGSYIVIVTRGHLCDKVVLEQALKSGAGYIGMIGSARKRDTIYRALMDGGVSAQQLEQVHCPIGLKIDTETPEEIAVSIVGELIDKRAQMRQWKNQASRQ
jgi:xanthine dehydrogenase accessory factor